MLIKNINSKLAKTKNLKKTSWQPILELHMICSILRKAKKPFKDEK